ncbi:MAG: putative ATP-binding cassette sub-family E member 1, partial [Streblomastix strix]
IINYTYPVLSAFGLIFQVNILCTEYKYRAIDKRFADPQFNTDVMKPMLIEQLMDKDIMHLSGGELQRVAIVMCLGKPADVYLIDEPSAYLDAEQRVVTARVIKRYIMHSKKTAFVVEHDFIMATYLADHVIVFEGTPSKQCIGRSPQTLLTGLNHFLSQLEITFRRDPTNFRPRINKYNSVKDREQKESGNYFFVGEIGEDEEGKKGSGIAAIGASSIAERKELTKKMKKEKRADEAAAAAQKKAKKEANLGSKKDLEDPEEYNEDEEADDEEN